MKTTKRICLELTTAEYEELARAVRAWRQAPCFDWSQEDAAQIAATVETLAAKMDANYERNGCP